MNHPNFDDNRRRPADGFAFEKDVVVPYTESDIALEVDKLNGWTELGQVDEETRRRGIGWFAEVVRWVCEPPNPTSRGFRASVLAFHLGVAGVASKQALGDVVGTGRAEISRLSKRLLKLAPTLKTSADRDAESRGNSRKARLLVAERKRTSAETPVHETNPDDNNNQRIVNSGGVL